MLFKKGYLNCQPKNLVKLILTNFKLLRPKDKDYQIKKPFYLYLRSAIVSKHVQLSTLGRKINLQYIKNYIMLDLKLI